MITTLISYGDKDDNYDNDKGDTNDFTLYHCNIVNEYQLSWW